MRGACALSVNSASYLMIWSGAIKAPMTFRSFHMPAKVFGVCSVAVVRHAPYSLPTKSKDVGWSSQLAQAVLCIRRTRLGTGQCEVLPQS